MIPKAPSKAPLHSLGQANQNEVQNYFLVMLCHWYWHHCHMMQMASPIAPLHSLSQDDQNEMQHAFFVMWCHWQQCQYHMMLMASPMAPLLLLGEAIKLRCNITLLVM